MNFGKRIYWVLALVAVLALAGTAVTVTSRFTSAGGPTPSPSAGVNEPAGGDGDGEVNDDSANASEPAGGDGDGEVNDHAAEANEADAADANEAEDGEAQAPSGTLDDGKDLLPQAKISVDAAVAAAQSAAGGSIGEVDLEQWNGKLVFNVDVGDKDVKVDASTGAVLSADQSD